MCHGSRTLLGYPDAMTLEVEDRIDLHELAARYGNVVDAQEWDRLPLVFAEAAVWRNFGFGDDAPTLRGCSAIADYLAGSQRRPISHHVTNIEATADGGAVVLRFKILAVFPSSHFISVEYEDEVVGTKDGWRIATHRATLRN